MAAVLKIYILLRKANWLRNGGDLGFPIETIFAISDL